MREMHQPLCFNAISLALVSPRVFWPLWWCGAFWSLLFWTLSILRV
jgi:hypothetical protein